MASDLVNQIIIRRLLSTETTLYDYTAIMLREMYIAWVYIELWLIIPLQEAEAASDSEYHSVK